MAGKVVITKYALDPNDNEKVEFDTKNDIKPLPDPSAGVRSWNIQTGRTRTGNPAPYIEEARKPDTGFSGTTYTLEVFFQGNATSTDPNYKSAIRLLQEWNDNPQEDDNFPEGYFGITNDYEPNWNVVRTDVEKGRTGGPRGYKIVSFNLHESRNAPGQKIGTIVFEFSGKALRAA